MKIVYDLNKFNEEQHQCDRCELVVDVDAWKTMCCDDGELEFYCPNCGCGYFRDVLYSKDDDLYYDDDNKIIFKV